MKIPKKVKIGIREFDVELVDGINNSGTPHISSDLGELSHDALKIRISNRFSEFIQIETFLHEICHAILSEIEEDKLSENEKLVSLLAKQLYILLTENDFFK